VEGHLYQRGNGRAWYLLYDVPAARGEKRQQRNIRIGKMSRAEATVRKRELLRQIDEGCYSEPAKLSAEEYFAHWLDSEKHYLATKTHERYASLLRSHVTPVIGQMLLWRITADHIEQVYERVRASGLSQRTCLHVHRVLHTAFAAAVRRKKLKENVVGYLRAPRVENRERAPISSEQVRLLIEATQGTRLAVPVALAAVTGLRRGELLALRWCNVSLEPKKGSLYVAEALEQTRQCGVRFKEPKGKSKRCIPLSPESVAILTAHKTAQDEAKRRAAHAYTDNDLVFRNPDGSPWPPDTFSKQFGDIARLVGMQGFRFHDVRHAFATLTLADGRPIKEVQLLMGHSTANTTLAFYARPVEGLGREAVNSLSRSLLSHGKGQAGPLPNVTKPPKAALPT
jgi:integrase